MARISDSAYRANVEMLAEDPTFVEGRMFGLMTIYHSGRLKFAFGDSDDPWDGLLVIADRSFHPSLLKEFPSLVPHPVLGKWLYISGNADNFNEVASKIMVVAARDDERIGIIPNQRKRKKKRVSAQANKEKKEKKAKSSRAKPLTRQTQKNKSART